MPRYFAEISYDGGGYHGWQIQPNAITVQQVINDNLTKLNGNKQMLSMGCGRTDTGVHARQFFFHFDTESDIDENLHLEKLKKMLPDNIVIHTIFKVNDDMHCRFSATSRMYRYYIQKKQSPFTVGHSMHVSKPLDILKMNEACKVLFKYKDFSCFSKSNTSTSTNNCDIFKANWNEEGEQLIFQISANRFLRNMVRAIVGTMLEVGKGNMTISEFEEVIKSKNRGEAGRSAQAQGLFLESVKY